MNCIEANIGTNMCNSFLYVGWALLISWNRTSNMLHAFEYISWHKKMTVCFTLHYNLHKLKKYAIIASSIKKSIHMKIKTLVSPYLTYEQIILWEYWIFGVVCLLYYAPWASRCGLGKHLLVAATFIPRLKTTIAGIADLDTPCHIFITRSRP